MASENNFCPTSFHLECDDKGPTITLIETTDDCVFGGYNIQNWNSSGQWYGKGKSTLANILTDSNKFETSAGCQSLTTNHQREEFTYNGKKFIVIDTCGFSDTGLDPREVMNLISDAYREIKMVFIKFCLLHLVLKFTTVVRTNFDTFGDQKETQNDIARLYLDKDCGSTLRQCNIDFSYSRKRSREILLNHLSTRTTVYLPMDKHSLH
ncbi:hypothetical protein CYY_002973 [Polysphondylium violaceum]|uniref:TLDc domain-containing protein n=1 Tax=Polysphondylium violaceum TaxID=133409 RepID=A0A8J4PY04_9MYCE|nr:hypothetical protein CYY_002973 [Polysphondylium violaceum]